MWGNSKREEAEMTEFVIGKIDGTFDYGACGIVPKIVLPIRKPKLRNNGYNAFGGHPRVHVPGLKALLPDYGGHVMVFYACGGRFGTYASHNFGGDLYDFS